METVEGEVGVGAHEHRQPSMVPVATVMMPSRIMLSGKVRAPLCQSESATHSTTITSIDTILQQHSDEHMQET